MPRAKYVSYVESSDAADSLSDYEYESASESDISQSSEKSEDDEKAMNNECDEVGSSEQRGAAAEIREQIQLSAAGLVKETQSSALRSVLSPESGHASGPVFASHLAPDEDEALYNGNTKPPEFYRQGIQSLNSADFKRKEYSKGTMKLMENCEAYWRSFCSDVLQTQNWEDGYSKINFETIYNFLTWYLNQKKGKGGRSKRPALVDLAKKFNLDHETRENRSLTLDDLKLQIERTLSSTSKTFKLGEMRILAVLFLLLLAPQGSRPQSILNIKFGDIDLLLIRDPKDRDGPPRLSIRLRLQQTKTYRGPKSMKTFLVPEIMYDPSLLLSPHTFLLSLLFCHRVFVSEALNDNPHTLDILRVHPQSNELCLRIKDSWKEKPLFRKCIKGPLGYVVSDKPITQNMTNKWINSIGKELGFEHNTVAYSLRYFAGNSLDQHVDISSDLRNLVLDHAPDSETFQKHYLNRNVCADLWAVHRDLNPQTALIRQATSHGGSRDSRRVFELTPEQIEAAKQNPLYTRIDEQLRLLPKRSEARRDLTRKRKNLYQRLKDAKLKEVTKEWTDQQALEDIELQIQGKGFSDNHRPSIPMGVSQQKMMDALTAPLVNDITAQLDRRANAIMALVAYCVEEEPVVKNVVLNACKPQRPSELRLSYNDNDPMAEIKNVILADPMTEIKNTVFASDNGNQVKRCFLCVAKALDLGKEHHMFDGLCRNFSTTHALAGHFTSVHLDGIQEHDKVPLDEDYEDVDSEDEVEPSEDAEVDVLDELDELDEISEDAGLGYHGPMTLRAAVVVKSKSPSIFDAQDDGDDDDEDEDEDEEESYALFDGNAYPA
ncbi:hypothetical protein F5Y18DRAFT_432324 [Xylariaceae sp. FL1019]|nr:hypothetical protein F5Y18DRAFT_432324 [Xylariaceae sp. FL1019]